jgi:metal-responsive CopG/Arc/MetJ family transcriptional regulator
MPNYKREGIKTKRIGVVLPEDVGLRLEQIAKDRAWSVSQTAATAIEEWLEQNETASQKENAA